MAIRHDLLQKNGRLRLGTELLYDPLRNKGTAFSLAERDALKLRGLLPPHVFSQQDQASRALAKIRSAPDPLQKYVAMAGLQDRIEALYFRILIDNLTELMPIVYTPTVGEACQKFGPIFQRPRGLYLSADDRGQIDEVLGNWPRDDVRVIVVTDGERILGLGDLGAHGMGIPVGKLNLYTACAGVPPDACLPITLDVGTDNSEFLADPTYLGLRQQRLRGDAYDELIEEFITAVARRYPKVLLQWEDFSNRNAFRLLNRYRDRICSFNDDIQGTAAVALAGLLASLRISDTSLGEHRLLFLGAGSAGTGIADLIVAELVAEGLDESEARQRCWFVDSRGLVCSSREDELAEHKRPYAHEHAGAADLQAAVEALRPTALIGVSGQPQTFTESIVRTMAAHNRRPVVFALSNPTSKAECTAEQAYRWSEGRAIFASGSPFDPVDIDGRQLVPGQANNAYVFPGIGLGVTGCGARRIPDEMFTIAARALACCTSETDLERGSLFPPIEDIRAVSLAIATAVAEFAWSEGLTDEPRPDDVRAHLQTLVFEPDYVPYV